MRKTWNQDGLVGAEAGVFTPESRQSDGFNGNPRLFLLIKYGARV